jgi:hypothetical protein
MCWILVSNSKELKTGRRRGDQQKMTITEQEPLALRTKLTAAAAIDYPTAFEIMVSFPDKWELVHQMAREDTSLYIAGMPSRWEEPSRDHFHGLPPGINLELDTYRLYRFFQPQPLPSFCVSWDEMTRVGRVEEPKDFKIQLQPLGQAQAWYGQEFGVIWECYLHETRRREAHWEDELLAFWRAVEEDIGVEKIFTEPLEPTFEEGYTDFLSRLGYVPDPAYPDWWSK